MKDWKFSISITILLFLFLIPAPGASAATLEDQMNNLVGPQQQYSTKLSPVYLRTNTTSESINPQNGAFTLVQKDYELPGRNGLDLEITRIYKGDNASIKEMSAKYVSGAWVDKVEFDLDSAAFYENRYNLGVGMRFSFPSIEIKENSDDTTYQYLHTESGDVYRLRPVTMDGEVVSVPDGQTIKDVVIRESDEFSNGQPEGVSKYAMTGKDGKKTFFDKDGVILGIEDRYGNRIVFENKSYEYKVGDKSVTKKLISKITDTVGRIVTFEYKEDDSYQVKNASATAYGKEESYKQSQNPDKTHSGDLEGKFQVIVNVPDGQRIVYDKTAALVDGEGHVLRTRLQRVFDLDGLPKYHFWYEQADLGFTFTNKNDYSVYNRYESLSQIDYVKTNRVTRYLYDKYRKTLSKDGSMEYLKLFEKRELVKTGYDKAADKFEDRFVTTVHNKQIYTYTNEADGFGAEGYDENDYSYLEDTYRYYTEVTDAQNSKTKYTYDGLHQLIVTEKYGADHKEETRSERDGMQLVKKLETLQYEMKNGAVQGDPVRSIENYHYDEYGNLTHYTGPEAERDENGEPNDAEHTTVYSYAYDKFHTLASKTWKQDRNTMNQIVNEIDELGNVTRETRILTDDPSKWIVSDYDYDAYGNVTGKTVASGGESFTTHYEYGIDADGLDVQGAYLTREYGFVDGSTSEMRYVYDFKTGNRTAEVDARSNRVNYQYDGLNRLVVMENPDGGVENYFYEDSGYSNFVIQYTDAGNTAWQYEYNIAGSLMGENVQIDGAWRTLSETEYDALERKTVETDANGHETRYAYDSAGRLVRKTMYDNQHALKGTMNVIYKIGEDSETPLLMTITDEEGNTRRYFYDSSNRLTRLEESPGEGELAVLSYAYDYAGNLIKETDALGNETSYAYDAAGRLLEKRDALDYKTTYVYVGMNQLAGQHEPGGKRTSYNYDELGRMTEKRVMAEDLEDYDYESYEYDPSGNVLRHRKAQHKNGEDTTASDIHYEYDVMNRVAAEKASIDDFRTGLVRYTYDKLGKLVSTVQYADAAGNKLRVYDYGYDYAGRLTEESGAYRDTAAVGGIVEHGAYRTVYKRDLAGNALEVKRENGNGWLVTAFTYDHLNKVVEKREPFGSGVKTTIYKYDKIGRLSSETLRVQGANETKAFVYDDMGRLVRMTDPLGNTSRYVYDGNGNRIKEIDPRYSSQSAAEAPGMEYAYDELNRLVKTSAYDGENSVVIAFNQYDGRGNVVLEADGEAYDKADPAASEGNRYAYDAANRLVSATSAQTAADNKKNAVSHVTKRLAYNGAGQVISETDAYGNITAYAYYLNGLLKEKIYPDSSKETYDYDLTGKAWQTFRNRNGAEMTTFLSIFDQPYRVDYPDGTTERMTYSPLGNMIRKIDRGGQEQRFEYDASGNVTAQTAFVSTSGNQTLFKRLEYGYDEAGRKLGSETFAYTEPSGGGASVKTSAGDKTVYVYDKAGRLLRVLGPNGRETELAYDRAGNMVLKRQKVADGDYDMTRYAYDTQSRLITQTLLVRLSDLAQDELAGATFDDVYVDRVQARTSYAYTHNGKVRSTTDAKGYTTSYEYDLDGRIVKETNPLLAEKTYRYDRKGQLTQETNAIGFSRTYEYDADGRLLREKSRAADGTLAVKRYVYDAVGNLVKEIKPNEYKSALDHDESVLEMTGTSYVYDAMNRRTSTISPEDLTVEVIAYDEWDRPVKVVDGIRYTGSMDESTGTSFLYDGLGRVIRQTDAIGHVSKMEWDILGNLVKTIDARGNITRFEYSPDGMLLRTFQADGGTMDFTYDKLGRKLTERNSLGAVTAYAYNSFGKEKSVTDALGHNNQKKYDLSGKLVRSQDKQGSASLYEYDASGRLIQQQTPLEKDGSGNTVYAVNGFVYDPAGNLLKESLSSSKDDSFVRETVYTYYDNSLLHTSTDRSGSMTKHEYDRNGNIVRTDTMRSAGVYDTEKFTYDASNRMVAQIRLAAESELDEQALTGAERDAGDEGYVTLVTAYDYDALGNRTTETDARGNKVRYAYDALNQLKSVTRSYWDEDVSQTYAYDGNGNRISDTDERGNVTSYAYDAMNRVLLVTDPEGGQLAYAYDLAGNKLSETNALGHAMSYAYDALNRLVTVTDPYDVVVKRNLYDAMGRIIKEIDAQGYSSATTDEERYGEQYVYDLAGRMKSRIDREGYETTYRYNPAGDLVTETNAMGEIYDYDYDGAGRLVSVTDPLDVTTSYSYDLAGNKLDMTDGRGKVTRYAYGSFGVLLSITNADGEKASYRYDLTQNMTEMTDALGRHTRYAYDSRNQMLEQAVEETSDAVRYTYNATGNRATMTDESGETAYAYDKNNRVVSITKNGAAYISYTYDAAGNVLSVTDKKGNLTDYTYDKSSRMSTVSSAGRTTTYTYDIGGNRTAVAYEGGVQERYAFDRNNKLTSLKNMRPDGSILSSYDYAYDGAGREISKTDSYGKTNYSYDGAGRVTKVEAPGKTTVYAYDKSSNRISMHETYTSAQPSGYTDVSSGEAVEYFVKKSEYLYSGANVLRQLVEKMLDENNKELLEKQTDFLYDANGNELRRQTSYIRPHDREKKQVTGANPSGDGLAEELYTLFDKTSNTFDGFNRLKQVVRIQDGVRSSVAYTYDGDGLRTRKVTRSSKDNRVIETNYVYDRQYVVLETDGDDEVSVRYVRGINYISRMDAADKPSYFLFNGHGDVVHTVSESGDIENQYDYDIFGNPILTIEVYASAIRYAGEFYDVEAGLYYLRARYYDPYIGRFVSEDMYRGEDNNPLSLNLYTYTHNDPINFWDPSGHAAIKKGMTGDSVKMVQEQLVEAGYNIAIDGSFGPKTLAAVKQFQRDQGITVDGYVGNQTLAYLKNVSATANAPDYAKQAALKEAAKAKPGHIASSANLMSNETFNAFVADVARLSQSTNSVVKTEVKNNQYVVTGITPKAKTPAPAPKQPAPKKPETTTSTSKPVASSTSSGQAIINGIKNTGNDALAGIKKVGNSIVEIGADFYEAADERTKNRNNSAYDYINYLTIGIPELAKNQYKAAEQRAEEMNDSVYDFANWASSGIVGMVDGAIFPEDPSSKEHLLNVLGVGAIAAPIKFKPAKVADTDAQGVVNGSKSQGANGNVAEGMGNAAGIGSAYDHVYTSTKPLDDVFPELKGVNPHYVDGAGPGVNTNCVSCANATTARLLGDDTTAVSSSSGYGTGNDLLYSAPFGTRKNLTVEDVNKLMSQEGDGAIGIVIINQGNIDHVINVVNRNGTTYYIDTQIGKIVELDPSLKLELGTR